MGAEEKKPKGSGAEKTGSPRKTRSYRGKKGKKNARGGGGRCLIAQEKFRLADRPKNRIKKRIGEKSDNA